MQKTKHAVQTVALSAVFAALIFCATVFLKIPILTGYIHLGDSMIFLAASILPPGYASVAAAAGAAIADVAGGFALWAPFTLVIKAAMALFIRSAGDKILTKRNVVMVFAASALNVVGYYFTEVILYGNWIAPFMSAAWNLLQFAGGVIVYLLLGAALDRIRVKRLLDPER